MVLSSVLAAVNKMLRCIKQPQGRKQVHTHQKLRWSNHEIGVFFTFWDLGVSFFLHIEIPLAFFAY